MININLLTAFIRGDLKNKMQNERMVCNSN